MSRATASRFGVPLSILTATALLAANASAQVFFSDFNSGVPAGASIPAGPAGDANEARVDGGYLKLTDAINSSGGTFYINDFTGGPVTRFTATFKASLFGSACCGAGTRPADGFSFNLVPAATVNPNPPYWVAEEGLNEGLAVNFDTWDNTVPGEPSIEVKWKGTVVPGTKKDLQPSQSPLGITDPVAASKDVFINLDPDGKITIVYGGVVVCDKVQTPYVASEIGTPTWVLGARTGGANDNHWIDDLKIVTVSPDVALVSPIAAWDYNDATVTPGLHGTGWELPNYNLGSAAGWKNGEALFGNDSAGIYDTATQPFAGRGLNGFSTPLDRTGGRVTFYFRTKFNWTGPTAGVVLSARSWVDDGLLAYLNGAETYRLRVPAAPEVLTWDTLGSNPPTEGAPENATWSAASLVQGENTVAVEVHQSSTGSSDVAYAMSLSARPPVPVTISDPLQPADRIVFASRSTTLTVTAYGSPAPTYQWFKDGAAIDPAVNPTATSASLVIPIMMASDAGAYYCTVANAQGSVNSRTAQIGYLLDEDPPVVVRATAAATFDKVVVEFDELIDPLTATDPFNLAITSPSGNGTITAVAPNPDGRSMTITIEPTAPLLENTVYTVTVSGVKDLTGNEIAGNNSVEFRTFVVGPGGGILFESFLGIAGNLVTDLVAHPSFPNSPVDRIQIAGFNSRLAYPDDSHETYGARMRGLFIPPVSGNWVLYMAADDGSQLKFNPNGPNAANAQVLLTRNACCGDYTSPNSRTTPQALTAGQGYYIELLYKEGGGGDWGQVAAVLEGQPVPPLTEYIPGSQLGVPSAPAGVGGPLTITTQPANASVPEQTTYTFSVVASNPNSLPIAYQWNRDGVAIPGATGSSYSALAAFADNGATFTVTLTMIGARVESSTATLTVTQDTQPPILLSAIGSGSMDRIIVKYNELMADDAEDPFNYAITPSISVDGAELLPDGMTVVLTLGSAALLAENTTYTVVAKNVSDRAVLPNVLAEGSATFSMMFAPQFLNFAAYHGTATPTTAGQIPGNLVTDLVGHPSFPNNPTESSLITAFNSRLAYPNDSHEQYGAKVSGVFIPPTSGNWIFYMAADDGSQLLFNPAGIAPSGKQILLTRDVCCGDYLAANSQSPPQALTAGTRYYIEMLYKEGGGGDWGQVAARLEGQPVPPISEVLAGGQIGTFIPTTSATITITDQPDDVAYFIDSSSSSGSGSPLLTQDFNSSNGGFTSTGAPAAFTGAFAYNAATGSWQVNAADAEISTAYTSRLQSPTLTVTKTGRARLTLAHRWSVEGDLWDGTQARISVNGGAFVAVPASAFTQGGYNGTVRAGNSVLQNQMAWVGDSAGHAAGTFVNSVAELGALNAGDTVQIELVYGGDTNTKGPLLPSWEINSIGLSEGGQDPVLRLTATVVPNQTLYYQWQRNNGAGYFDILGATGPSYTLNPTLADNGAKFRAVVYVPGTYVTSGESTLSVIQLNTPPRFNPGGPDTVLEDSGPRVVANWATDILPYSIGLQPANFTAPPAGGILGGNTAISGGVLHLTDAINSQQSSYATPASPVPVDSFTLTFKARIGGGTCCGNLLPDGSYSRTADGWSVSIGDIPIPVTFPVAAEEGAGMVNGLAINFDTWDNAGVDDASTAPNVDVKVGGNIVAYQALAGDREGGRAPSGPIVTDPATGQPMSYKTGTGFTDVRIRVDADGTVDVDFKGVRVVDNVQSGLTFPLNNARIAFGARTGGANDNHWIDDMLILGYYNDALVVAYPEQTASSAEAGQTVSFLVSNDNPSLFSAQPSIAPDGTLSYTPAPNANGVATVTVIAKDNGGVVGGGDDTSNPVTFTITVTPVNDCPTAGSQTVSANSGVAKSITLTGSDVDGNALQYAVVQAPAHGVLIVQPSGAATYTSAAGYSGPDSFSYTVTDGTCVSGAGVVTINVLSANTAPTARIVATPLVDFSPDIANKVVISGNGTNGCLTLDGSLSSDAESPITDLTFAWAIEPGLPFATGVSASICLELGTHTIGLTVKDPQGLEGHDTLTVEVISAGEAIEDLINRVNDSTIARNNKRPFIASLKAAAASADRGNNEAAANQLHAFQNKVRAQVSKSNPAEAAIWTRWAQSIIDALNAGQ